MIQAVLFLIGGTIALYFGAEWLVRGAGRAGAFLGVPSLVIGLTVVSLGTSAPELVVSVVSAVQGRADLALGNVLGSNLANVGLILGLVALIHPVEVSSPAIRRDIPLMIGVTVVLLPLLLDLELGRWDGLILLGLLAMYLALLARTLRKKKERGPDGAPAPGGAKAGKAGARLLGRSAVLVVVGSAVLVLGGHGIVLGAVALAQALEVPELLIGLSVVAVGTSLPELAASLVAALRGNAGIALGNVVGSNLFNLTAVLGVTALVQPLAVDPGIPGREFVAVLALSVLLVPLTGFGRRIGRRDGVLLLVAYGATWWWFVASG